MMRQLKDSGESWLYEIPPPYMNSKALSKSLVYGYHRRTDHTSSVYALEQGETRAWAPDENSSSCKSIPLGKLSRVTSDISINNYLHDSISL
ncbi:unnamed protein product [Nezara viridula]|uniref:Uncharacterized protein n=1 Tax=Nezara viridula TaxID=85310 RepID=A0A9P0MLF9_NEZVI|nr:unnamed protein product [Nezara viridula]